MARGKDVHLYRNTGATCVMCGVIAGNSLDIPVYRYRLQRSAYRTGLPRSQNVGAIGLCDPCIEANTEPLRDYRGRNTSRKHRHIRLEGMVDEWHQHADYVPRHTHPAMGPDRGFEP